MRSTGGLRRLTCMEEPKMVYVTRRLAFIALFTMFISQAVSAAETTLPEFSIKCTTTGQRCAPQFSTQVETRSRLQMRYTVRSGHCSSIRARIFVDGALKTTTPFLGFPNDSANRPLSTGLLDLGPVSPGKHVLSMEAEGQADGCNTGTLASWGGTVVVITDEAFPDVLQWEQIPQNQSGPLFPTHFRATVPGGTLILSVLNRATGDGVALSFVRQTVT